MLIAIIVEIVLGASLLVIASAFWDCAKSPRVLGKLLGDYEELRMLKGLLLYESKAELALKSHMANPNLAYPLHIADWIQASLSALARTRNILLVVATGVVGGSYFLGLVFPFINIALFLLMAFVPVCEQAKGNLRQDVHTLMRLVYRWNAVAPAECERFCNQEQPRMLQAIYRVVTEE